MTAHASTRAAPSPPAGTTTRPRACQVSARIGCTAAWTPPRTITARRRRPTTGPAPSPAASSRTGSTTMRRPRWTTGHANRGSLAAPTPPPRTSSPSTPRTTAHAHTRAAQTRLRPTSTRSPPSTTARARGAAAIVGILTIPCGSESYRRTAVIRLRRITRRWSTRTMEEVACTTFSAAQTRRRPTISRRRWRSEAPRIAFSLSTAAPLPAARSTLIRPPRTSTAAACMLPAVAPTRARPTTSPRPTPTMAPAAMTCTAARPPRPSTSTPWQPSCSTARASTPFRAV